MSSTTAGTTRAYGLSKSYAKRSNWSKGLIVLALDGFDTVGWVIRSCRSISPTDCCELASKLNIARRFGSAMIWKTDSTTLYTHIRIYVSRYI